MTYLLRRLVLKSYLGWLCKLRRLCHWRTINRIWTFTLLNIYIIYSDWIQFCACNLLNSFFLYVGSGSLLWLSIWKTSISILNIIIKWRCVTVSNNFVTLLFLRLQLKLIIEKTSLKLLMLLILLLLPDALVQQIAKFAIRAISWQWHSSFQIQSFLLGCVLFGAEITIEIARCAPILVIFCLIV